MIDKPTIIDFFSYAGEFEVLDIRLHELNPLVSHFLIAESNRTQTGLEKPYYFEKHKKDLPPEILSKIIYLKLDDSKLDEKGVGEADWNQEFRVRESLATEGIQLLQDNGIILMANDIILISDVDEIPKKDFIEWFIKSSETIAVCNHYFGSYYLNLISNFRNWGWYGTIACRVGAITLNRLTIRHLRNNKDRLPRTGQAGEGWHFSSLLTKGFNGLYNKWKNNIEPHDKSCLINKEILKEQFNKCLYEDMNFFFCDLPDKREILFEKLDLTSLPEYVRLNQEKFKKVIFSNSYTV